MMTQDTNLAAMDDIEQTTTTQLQSNHTPQALPSSIEGADITTHGISSTSHAGSRITSIYELLELCLLDLPIQDLLLAQRVNKRFNAVINTSPRLREKLFFTSRLAFGQAFKAKLNPLVVREDVMRAIPLYFDYKEKRLACCYREGCERLWCRSVTATTVWVYLEFCDGEPQGGLDGGRCGFGCRGLLKRRIVGL
jgi:hypothetical protein